MFSDNNKNKLTVVSFIGPTGAGKTKIITALSTKYETEASNYMELDEYQLDNKLITSKWFYFEYWFRKVLSAQKNDYKIILTDRCPYDTCAYVDSGRNELSSIVNSSFKELNDRNITIKKVLITANFDVLQERINKRLLTDQVRIKYHEDDVSYNKRAYEFYMDHKFLCDYVIDTSNISKLQMIDEAKKIIELCQANSEI